MMDEASVRRYSWQFYRMLVHPRPCRQGPNTYSTEEMPDEDDELSRSNMRRLVELLEGPALAVGIEHQHIRHLAEVLLGGYVVVDVERALKLLLLLLQHGRLARWREGRRVVVHHVHGGFGVACVARLRGRRRRHCDRRCRCYDGRGDASCFLAP